MLIVEKKDKTLRLCLDPRDLNVAIKREHYMLPTCEDVISKMLTIAGPLLGALVGGVIASLTGRCLERQRWRHERQEKLLCMNKALKIFSILETKKV